MTKQERRILNKEKIIDLKSPDWNLFGLFNLVQTWGMLLNLPNLKQEKEILFQFNSFKEFLDHFDKLFKDKVNYTFINDPREKKNEIK